MNQEDEILKTIQEITARKQELEKRNSNRNVGNTPPKKKKVYRSIFGPQSESESDSDASSYSDSSVQSSAVTPTKQYQPVIDSSMKPEACTPDKQFEQNYDQLTSHSTDSYKEKDTQQTDEALIVDIDAKPKITVNEDTEPKPDDSLLEQSLLSPTEKVALSHIANEIGRCLNADKDSNPVQLYMGPYGKIKSPFKKVSSFQGFPRGVKRSLTSRKLDIPHAKRTKLFDDDDCNDDEMSDEKCDNSSDSLTSNQPQPDDLTFFNNSKGAAEKEAGSGEESSEEDQWQIVESDGENKDIDKELDTKSNKFCLSAINVKSIIHKIITNDSVVEMVRKAVQEEMEGNEGKYEPKMTRAKLKQFEAQGQVPTSWALSPTKQKPESTGPNFLEMELPEDEEEDEDFNPEKVVPESDEDSESVVSSCISDIGSPAPSTPRSEPTTPGLNTLYVKQDKEKTPSVNDSDNSQQSLLSPMGPPLVMSVPKSQQKSSTLGRKFQDRMDSVSHRYDQETEEELIPFRTRSKYPLTEHSILEFEANFVAPDMCEDLYDTSCDDHDWREFLTQFSLLQQDATITEQTADADDEEEDPEYNFLEEVEEYEVDQEDFRDDRAVKVSKKEVNLLLDELYDSHSDLDPLDDACKQNIKTQSEKIVLHSNKRRQYQQRMIQEIGEHERKQISDQLRKHVQLLAQTFVMSQNSLEEHDHTASVAEMYLRELQSFSNRTESRYQSSTFYRACNLESALSLLDNYHRILIPGHKESDMVRLDGVIFKYDNQILPALSFRQMYIMWSDPTFMFPDLLPYGGFFKHTEVKKDRSRVKFLRSEDNLLAMGLSQFSHLSDSKDYIQKFMLPVKSRKQIKIRIKNLVANAAKDNAVKFWKKFKMLPRFEQIAPDFEPSMMIAVKDRDMALVDLPFWCKFFSSKGQLELIESARDLKERQRALKRKKKARQSVSFSAPDVQNLMSQSPQSASAPVTPINQLTGTTSSSSTNSIDELPIRKKCVRLKRQYRKRLMRKKQKESMSILGSFLPLSLPDHVQTSPITICMINSSSVTTPVTIPIPTSIAALCNTPVTLLGTPQLSQSVTSLGAPQLSQPVTNLGMPQLSQPVTNLGMPQLSQSVTNLGMPQLSQSVTNLGMPQLSQSVTNLGTTQLSRPLANLGTPQLSQPVANLGTPQLNQPVANLETPQFSQPVANFGTPHLSQPVANLGTPQLSQPGTSLGNPQFRQSVVNLGPQQLNLPSSLPGSITTTGLPIQQQANLNNTLGQFRISTPNLCNNPAAVTSATPTIIVINHTNPIRLPNTRLGVPTTIMAPGISTRSQSPSIVSVQNNSSILSMPRFAVPSQNLVNVSLSGNMPTLNPELINMPTVPTSGSTVDTNMPTDDLCDIDSQLLTFEELCRPIMEAEMASGTMLQGNQNLRQATVSPAANVTPGLGINSAMLVSEGNPQLVSNTSMLTPISATVSPLQESVDNVNVANELSTVKGGNQETSSVLSSGNNSNVSDQKAPPTKEEIQSEEISSTTPEKHSADVIASGSAAGRTIEIGEYPREVTPTEELERDSTPAPRCMCTPTRELDYQSNTNHQSAQLPTTAHSSTVKTPKSAIEMLAAYAPIFMPTQNNIGTLTPEQRAQETTPQKNSGSRYVKLLPKPTPPSCERFDPAMFKFKKSPRSSPRRKQFKQQAKAILPKGFVISTFDTSPAKKAASTLVDKAKQQVKGYCNILPRPPGYQPYVSPIKLGTRSRRVRKNLQTEKSFQRSEKSVSQVRSSATNDKENNSSEGNVNNNANYNATDTCSDNAGFDENNYDDRGMDTESDDYTQSEDDGDTQGTDDGDDAMDTQGSDGDETQGTDGDDGNDTQGTDLDSQDESQEEDEGHIADLMTASTTLRFAPIRDEDLIRARLGKKDRDRDITLAMLAPDIIEDDPQRDMRDTMFVQSYLQRVKKVLKGDIETLEKFLRMMAGFTKTEETAIQLYKELKEVFVNYPDLLYDFAGFLQLEQAVECGCYKACKEFHQARSFLRKLEIFFSKNTNQYQKMMRILSRWYKKTGRNEQDLREQIEPLLKGHKHLLEEFSRFFPNDKPPDSHPDDFEEINFEGSSGEEEKRDSKDSSFEEIELLDLEEVYGTKRCNCVCHDCGDDTFKKRKKHCYKCCLTVIDGELVYKVNKSTIKKINVTLGPPVKLSSLLPGNEENQSNPETTDNQSVISREPAVDLEADDQLPASKGEPEKTDMFESEDADKENRDVSEGTSQTEELINTEELERPETDQQNQPLKAVPTDDLSVNAAHEDDTVNRARPVQNLPIESHIKNSIRSGTDNEEQMDVDSSELIADTELDLGDTNKQNIIAVESSDKKETLSKTINSENVTEPKNANIDKDRALLTASNTSEEKHKVSENSLPTSKSAPTNVSNDSCMSLANDILAAAFNTALTTEVSMDSISVTGPSTSKGKLPLSKASTSTSRERHPSGKGPVNISTVIQTLKSSMPGGETSVDLSSAVKPSVQSASGSHITSTISAPKGESEFIVSNESSFSQVFGTRLSETKGDTAERCKADVSRKEKDEFQRKDSPKLAKLQMGLSSDLSRSPPFSPFSPFSPFGQEIQNINAAAAVAAAQLAAANNSSASQSQTSTASSKIRRITPIPVKGIEDSSSFQTVMMNSPVLADTNNQEDKSNSNPGFASNKVPISAADHSDLGTALKALCSDSGSDSKTLVESLISHKSNSNMACSQSSGNSESPMPSITISQPVTFSENANVGFPKIKPKVHYPQLSLLSEESLFQCLSKPPQFSDTLPCVSNLTNILHALDGKSQNFETVKDSNVGANINVTEVVGGTEQNIVTDPCTVNDGDVAQNIEISAETKSNNFEKVVQDKDNSASMEVNKKYVETKGKYSTDALSSGSSSNSSQEGNKKAVSADQYVPQSVQSIENMKRLQQGLFEVSRLSDSDSSNKTTPSKSLTSVDRETCINRCNCGALDTPVKGTEVYKITGNVERDKELPGNLTLRSEICDEAMTEVHAESNVSETGENSTRGKGNERRLKMTRRELRKSLHGRDQLDMDETEEFDSETDENAASRETMFEDNGEVQKAVHETDEISVESSANTDNNQGTVNLESRTDEIVYKKEIDIDKFSNEGVKREEEREIAKLNEITPVKSEPDTDNISICDSMSETSSRGKKKSKHKKHKSDKKKKKKRKEGEESDGTAGKEKKKLKRKRKEKDKEGDDKDDRTTQQTSSRDDTEAHSSMSTVEGAQQSDDDEEPNWSKETDKTILETCKVHGIKEKTFVKIARNIGNVTAKQVQKRFGHLYQMIFGMPFGEKKEKD